MTRMLCPRLAHAFVVGFALRRLDRLGVHVSGLAVPRSCSRVAVHCYSNRGQAPTWLLPSPVPIIEELGDSAGFFPSHFSPALPEAPILDLRPLADFLTGHPLVRLL